MFQKKSNATKISNGFLNKRKLQNYFKKALFLSLVFVDFCDSACRCRVRIAIADAATYLCFVIHLYV